MTRTERIKAQEEKVAAAARKLKLMRAQETEEQRKKRTHTLIQVGAIIEVVGIPVDTSRDILTGAWARVAKMIETTPAVLAEFAAEGAQIIEARNGAKENGAIVSQNLLVKHNESEIGEE